MRAPASLQLHRKSGVLDVAYADGTRYELPCEYLRVFSPSADVRGHTGGGRVLGRLKLEVQRLRCGRF